MMIDQQTVERILDAAQIVEVVSEFVSLRKAGVNYKGLCPFHADKDPSLVVSPAKGLYKCFSCGHGGNAVKFIMEHEQLNYPDALRWLANKYHIDIQEKEQTNEERQRQSERESMFVLNDWACHYFQDILENNVDGRAIGMAYFRSRGFRDDTIKKFQLGYSLSDKYALAKEAKNKGFENKYLLSTGLCYEKENGHLHDRFYGRAIFPVHTISGKVVAFGGRVLDAATKGVDRKYINSPESDIYNKSRELYGLYQAKQAIVRENRCFLVEGYTDVISMHQSGIQNVVSSSGTSLTFGQIQLLHRFTTNITLLYDGDVAGIKASLRGIDMLLQEGMNIKILLLPDGDDPDSFARKHTAKEFQNYIDEHQVDFIRFKTDLLLKEIGNDPLKRAALIKDIVQSIAVIPDNIVQSEYIKETAKQLETGELILLNEISNIKKQTNATKSSKSDSQSSNVTDSPSEITPIPSATDNLTEHDSIFKKETLIMKEIVRHGDQAFAEVEDENGETKSINVLEYIAYSFKEDKLEFRTELYKEIMQELHPYIKQKDFCVQRYLMSHPDVRFSNLATELSTNKYYVGKNLDNKNENPSNETLSESISRLLTELKLLLIEMELRETNIKQLDPTLKDKPERQIEILIKFKELSAMKIKIARQAGDRIVLPSMGKSHSAR